MTFLVSLRGGIRMTTMIDLEPPNLSNVAATFFFVLSFGFSHFQYS